MKTLELNQPNLSLSKPFSLLGRALFWILVWLGKPFGGIRPRRIYYYLGRWLFLTPEFRWYKHRAGFRMLLSPHLYMDRVIISLGMYDEALHRVISALVKPGMVCMDVGANMGEFTLHMAQQVGASGAVFSFEPVPTVRERLVNHVNENRLDAIVQICPVALSNQVGQVDISYANELFENQGMGSIVNTANPRVPLKLKVPTITLDEFVTQHKVSRIDLIKIDTQGAEPLILRGAIHTLKELRPMLLIEVSPGDLDCLGMTSPQLIAEIEELGYRAYEISDSFSLKLLSAKSLPDRFTADNVFCAPADLGALPNLKN